jgi:hypothetical protein
MRVHSLFAGAVITAASVVSASADTIIAYDTEGVGSGAPTASHVNAIDPDTGVTGINVTRGSALTPVAASFALNSSGWNAIPPNPNANYQFGFTTTKVYYLSDLTVGLRSSNTGPGYMLLQYEKNGASSWTTLGSPIKLFGTNFLNYDVELSGIGPVHSELLFQLVVDPAHTTNAQFNSNPSLNPTIGPDGTFRFASFSPSPNVFVNPEITGSAVPEPSSVLLFLFGVPAVAGVALYRRIKRAA